MINLPFIRLRRLLLESRISHLASRVSRLEISQQPAD